MGKYRFYKDEKVITWQRTCFVVEAETLKKAEELAKQAISKDIDEVGSYESSEFFAECVEYNKFTPDKYYSTVDILNAMGELIIDNRPNNH